MIHKYGSMGPKGHVRGLDLVMGDMPGAQCVQNDRLRGSFLAQNPHVGGGFSGTFLSSNIVQVAGISSWNDSYGSMGPKGHVGYLALVTEAMISPQWV